MSLRSMLGKSLVSTSSSPTTEKSNTCLNPKMSSKHILETAKTSQLSWGTCEKKKKGEFCAGDIPHTQIVIWKTIGIPASFQDIFHRTIVYLVPCSVYGNVANVISAEQHDTIVSEHLLVLVLVFGCTFEEDVHVFVDFNHFAFVIPTIFEDNFDVRV